MDCVSVVNFLLISVHPDTSTDLWNSILGPKGTKKVLSAKMKDQGASSGFQIHFIDFITGLCIPCELLIDFSASRHLNRPVDLHYGPKKDEKWYFPPKWRLKVHNLDFKCFSPILLVNWVALVTILFFSVHPDTSIDPWTSFSGPKRTKNGIFRQNDSSRSLIWVLDIFDRLY